MRVCPPPRRRQRGSLLHHHCLRRPALHGRQRLLPLPLPLLLLLRVLPQGERWEGARGGSHGEPRALRRVRPAQDCVGEADLGRAGGAQARLRVPEGVRHGGSGARRVSGHR